LQAVQWATFTNKYEKIKVSKCKVDSVWFTVSILKPSAKDMHYAKAGLKTGRPDLSKSLKNG